MGFIPQITFVIHSFIDLFKPVGMQNGTDNFSSEFTSAFILKDMVYRLPIRRNQERIRLPLTILLNILK
jgi:hypothetical protein